MARHRLPFACPLCGDEGTMKVLDSMSRSMYIKRRRECSSCKKRFDTYERVGVAVPAHKEIDEAQQEIQVNIRVLIVSITKFFKLLRKWRS